MPIFQIPFGETEVTVYDETPSHKEIDIHWESSEGRIEVTLKALWRTSPLPQANGENGFQPGDYFQHTITASPTGHGLGPRLLDFIAQNRAALEFDIQHYYSTQVTGDATGMSEHAKKMWGNLVDLDKAILNTDLNRYQLLWQE